MFPPLGQLGRFFLSLALLRSIEPRRLQMRGALSAGQCEERNQRKLVLKISLIGSIFLLAGCATASHAEREALLSAPVSCEQSKADIAALEDSRPSQLERIGSALQVLTPIGIVTGLAKSEYRDRIAVMSGKTRANIDHQISSIQTACARDSSSL